MRKCLQKTMRKSSGSRENFDQKFANHENFNRDPGRNHDFFHLQLTFFGKFLDTEVFHQDPE